MSYYHKYRPRKLDDMYGNREVLSVLGADLAKADPPRAYLFHGPTGCGKTTLARIVAAELGCEGRDLQEIDSSSYRGIDTVRTIQQQVKFAPLDGRKRVWILDECHQTTSAFQNALLKLLEDCPAHAVFILCTTDPDKLLATVRGRCATYNVTLLSDKESYNLLAEIAENEGLDLDDKIYDYIIESGDRHPRNMVQLLERVAAAHPEDRLDVAKAILEDETAETIELCRALMRSDGWSDVKKIVAGLKGHDVEKVRRSVMGYCSAVLLKGGNASDRAFRIMDVMCNPFYNNGYPELVFASYALCRRS